MDNKKSYYAVIPANVRYDKELTPNAKLLYGEITALCNEKGYCWATNAYFAELYGVSKKSISKWIKDLIDKKYIQSELIYKECSKEILHRYIRIVPYPMEEKFHTPMEEKVKDNNTGFNNTSNNTLEDIYPFDDFWTAYPKKKAKEAAKKAWVKLKPDEALGKTIIQAVLESAKTQDWKKENGKYIPYPATYLNGKRWEDEGNDTNGQNTGNPRKVQYGTVL
jgi:post-segregation antitoxin (ccd killing protein)